MPASEAQVAANRRNAALSTGPKSEEGKARSRGNSLKHGLTGGGVVLPEEDHAEVERLAGAFQHELAAPGEAGRVLARRMATLAVRMGRCAEQEAAATSGRVREALDGFETPEGVEDDQAERLRAEAGNRALFDPSPDATLARRYEAAAERGFFRCLKELRQLGREPAAIQAPAESRDVAEARSSLARLASFFPAEVPPRPEPPRPAPAPAPEPPTGRPGPISPGWDPFPPADFEVPIAIGRRGAPR